MTDATDRSAEDIERELKRIRSEIDRTASAIQDRLTPEAVFDHALAYVRGPGGRRILEAVQRNPLPAVLAAVAIGWLLLSVRQTAEDRGPGQPHRTRPQEPPPSPVPRMSETPPSGATTPSASPAPGAAASDAPPL
jgi:hypothetical protein